MSYDPAGPIVVQTFCKVASIERDAALFLEFAQCCFEEVGVGLLAPSSGERPVPRPGIARTLRSPHEEDRRLRSGGVNNRNSRARNSFGGVAINKERHSPTE